MNIDENLKKKLTEKKKEHLIRKLKKKPLKSDFCSNDYLGLARSETLFNLFLTDISSNKNPFFGSTGSRLISGNSKEVEDLEKKLSSFFLADSALLMNSGYQANIGLMACVAQKSDTIYFDECCHASIRDGIRLSFAKSYSFKHNDMEDLSKKISLTGKGNIFIVTEALFSMDGDFAKLAEILKLAEKHSAAVILDEAHSTGIIGSKGRGLACALKLQDKVFARVHTFGKAAGCFGACVAGSKTLTEYLINHARSFIFTTALPYFNLSAIKLSLNEISAANKERKLLQENIEYFQKNIPEQLKENFLISHSPIQGFILPGNRNIKEMAESLKKHEFDVNAILHPSVPKGKERIRLTLHSFNTKEEIKELLMQISHAF